MAAEFALSLSIDAEDVVAATDTEATAVAIFVAVILGVCLSGISNTDWLHSWLRRLGLTRETSFPSEWYSTFARYGENAYIVLHLHGERRLYGFAEEWPSDPKAGQFRIAEAEWVDDANECIALEGVSAALIRATEVTMVEFVPMQDEVQEETD